MAITKMFKLVAIKTATTNYSQLADATLNTNAEQLTVHPTGGTIPVFTAANRERPEVTFGTHQVSSALSQFGLLGADPGVTKLICHKMSNKGSRVAVGTGEHVTFTVNSALSYLMSITAGNNQQAVAQGRMVLLYDGSNAPYIYSGSATIGETMTGGENYVLGPISIAGTIREGTNDFSLQINPVVEEPDDDYLITPVYAAMDRIAPIVSFTTTDPGIWSLNNTAISGNGVRVNLVKKKANGDRELDAASEHILMTMTTGLITCEAIAGATSRTRVRVVPVSSNGTLSPVIVTLASPVVTT